MAPSTHALLQKCNKPHLTELAGMLKMTVDDKKTRTALISEIKDTIETYPDFAESIRKRATELITEHANKNTNNSQTQTLPSSQMPLFDTQPDPSMEIDEDDETSGLKRKNTESEADGNEPRTRIINNAHKITRNFRDCLNEMKNEIIGEMRDIIKEHSDSTDIKLQGFQKNITKELEEFQKNVILHQSDLSKKHTQIFTDNVSLGMEKTQNNIRIGVETLTAHIPLLINEAQKKMENVPTTTTASDPKSTEDPKISGDPKNDQSKSQQKSANSNPCNAGINSSGSGSKSSSNTAKQTDNSSSGKSNTTEPKNPSGDKPIIVLVTASNGKGIDRSLLKPEAYVVKVLRYTIKEATDSIPWVSDKSKVTDIVFQVGLNDLRKGSTADEIQTKSRPNPDQIHTSNAIKIQ